MRTPPPNTLEESVLISTMKIDSSQLPDEALGQELPITLNKAYSYLIQVRAQFINQLDIYSTFLDILKDSNDRVIGIRSVVSRVSKLFAGHPRLIQGFNLFLPPEDRIECDSSNDPNATCYRVARYELTPISPIDTPEMPVTPLNTRAPTELSEPVAPSATHEISTLTSMLSEQLGTGTKTGYQIEYGASNDTNTSCATDYPAYNALTLTQTAQGAGMNGVAPQKPDAAKDAEPSDLSTMMDPWNTILPPPPDARHIGTTARTHSAKN
ncbi:hypothetical protein MauCBS54593_006155 [Microsporum audouinii]